MKKFLAIYWLGLIIFFTNCNSGIEPAPQNGKIRDTSYVIYSEDSLAAIAYDVHGTDTAMAPIAKPAPPPPAGPSTAQ